MLLTGSVLLAMEFYLRSLGHQPTVMDDYSLWSYWREDVRAGGSNMTVLVGSSRMQLGISTEEWRTNLPQQKMVQLAFDAGSPVPVLEDLASEEEFHGTVVCELTEYRIVRSSYFEKQSQGFVSYYHKRWNLQKLVDRTLRTALYEHVVVACPGRDWKRAVGDIIHARPPQMRPYYMRTLADRSRQADYQLAFDTDKQTKNWLDDLTQAGDGLALRNNGEWPEAIRRIKLATEQIQAHGGRVVFVRFPTSGALRKLENKLYPRSEFWDEFVRTVKAPTIYFEDVPSLRNFTCPDGSHLDTRDAVRFTRSLVEEMKSHGIF